jgi:hypothetical protein
MVVSAYAIKAYRGSGGITPLILNLATTWVWVVSLMLWWFTTAPTPGKHLWLGAPNPHPPNANTTAACFKEERNFLHLQVYENRIVQWKPCHYTEYAMWAPLPTYNPRKRYRNPSHPALQWREVTVVKRPGFCPASCSVVTVLFLRSFIHPCSPLCNVYLWYMERL